MYLTENEIMMQHEALQRTYDYMTDKKEEIAAFFRNHDTRKFLFLGCGSSYMLAKSAQRVFGACPGTAANAVAGGDYLVNPAYYENVVKDSIVVVLSRSGQTTEIVRAVRQMTETYQSPVISLSMKADNEVDVYAKLSLTFDWCYDKSVCQTRTVTNLYTAMLLLCSIYNADAELEESVRQAVEANEDYKMKYRPVLEEIAGKDWDNAVVLSDGALCGLGEEGALAFTEISMLHGKSFQLLDYRHGPIVLNDAKTLTIAVLQPGESCLQGTMIRDLKAHGGIVVTVSGEEENVYEADVHICVGKINRYEAYGIPFIYVMQMIAYEKSVQLGRNPDAPAGLDAFITF